MEHSAHNPAQDPLSSSLPSSSSYVTAEENALNRPGSILPAEATLSFSETPLTIEELQSRIGNLEKILAEKDAALLSLKAELDATRDTSGIDASIGPLSHGFEADYKVYLAEYIKKLEEYSTNIALKDEMIQNLRHALQQCNDDRQTQNKQISDLNNSIMGLQSQLQSVSEHLQEPQKKLLTTLKEKEKELKCKTVESAQCKAQSAKEVQSLMLSLEQLQQRESKAPVVSNFCDETSQQTAKELEYEKLSSDMYCMQLTHDMEVTSLKEEFQKTLHQCNTECKALKEEVKSLQLELNNARSNTSLLQTEVQTLTDLCQKRKDDLHKYQTEHSLEVSAYLSEVNQYKVQLERLQIQYADALDEKLASHHAELILSQERLREMHAKEKDVLHEEIIKREEQLKSMQLSHGTETFTIRQELELIKQELCEKTALIQSRDQKISLLEKKLHSEHEKVLVSNKQIHALNNLLTAGKNETSVLKQKVEYFENKYQTIKLSEEQLRKEHIKFQKEQLEMNKKQLILEQQCGMQYKEKLDAANGMCCQQEESALKQGETYSQMSPTETHDLLSLEKEEKRMLCHDFDAAGEKSTNVLESIDVHVQQYLEHERMSLGNELQSGTFQSQPLLEDCNFSVNQIPADCKGCETNENDNITKTCKLSSLNLLAGPCTSEDIDGENRSSGNNTYDFLSNENFTSSLKDAHEVEKLQNLCKVYKVKIDTLEQQLKSMSEVNSHLKEQRKSAENELSRLQMDYKQCKTDFQERCNSLQNNLSAKEEELENLIKHSNELQFYKDEIHSYNQKVKELLSVKKSLEDDLTKCHKMHDDEVSCYKKRVIALEEELQSNAKRPKFDAIVAMLETCRRDLEIFKEYHFSDEEEQNVKLTDDHCKETCSLELEHVGRSSKDSLKKQSSNTTIRCGGALSKPTDHRLIGIRHLERLLQICDESLSKQPSNEETLALHLSKSNILVEKLQVQLEEASEQSTLFSVECEKLKAYCKVVEEKLRANSTHGARGPNTDHPDSDTLSNVACNFQVPISSWITNCKELEERNDSLSKELHLSQLKLKELEIEISSDFTELETAPHQKELKSSGLNEIDSFSAEWQILQSKVEELEAKFSEKDVCCLKNMQGIALETLIDSSMQMEDTNKVMTLLETASESCDLLLNKKKIEVLKLKNHMSKLLVDKQSDVIASHISCMKELHHENSTLQSKLHCTVQKMNVLQARLNRVEAFYSSQKEKEGIMELGMIQLVENLEVSNLKPTSNSEKNLESRQSLFHYLDTSLKIVIKMVKECEPILAKSQTEHNTLMNDYLQSEALTLRRLQSYLQEMQQALVSRSGPVMQVHVDFLNLQLLEKEALYTDACDTLYALEAELRKLEDVKLQSEEKLSKELHRCKTEAKYWQFKSETIENIATIEEIQRPNFNEDLFNVIAELNAIYLKSSSEIYSELQMTSTTRENQIRADMAEQISTLELKHKDQLAVLAKHSEGENSLVRLEVLHKQELAAANAVHEFTLQKHMLELRKQLSSSLNFILQLKPISMKNLCLQLMKHDVSAQFKAAVRKITVNWSNEWEKQFLSFDAHLEKLCEIEGSALDVDVSCVEDILQVEEEVVCKTKYLCEKLKYAYSSVLQTLLSTVEKEFSFVIQRLQVINENTQEAVSIAALQKELKLSEEKHRLAIESLTAHYTAEETRLRLLLSEASQCNDSNESSLIALRRELEDRHKREMEDLRTYFEQKCADFEKHYSEEVFSQHSRKLSDTDSASESEIVSEMYYAGPGSAASMGPVSQSHLCDSFGESSFKDFEQQPQNNDLEKLLQENQNELEAMRLALESRHQGELEAQKELYEAKLEELLRVMSESHNAELRMQSRKLEELHDMENILKHELASAQGKIGSLQTELKALESSKNDSTLEVKNLSSEQKCRLNAKVQFLTDALKKKESDSTAQIATLKAKLRENCDAISKLERENVILKTKCNEDLVSLKTMLADRDSEIEKMRLKIRECSSDEQTKFSAGLKKNEEKMNNKLEEQLSNFRSQQEKLLREKEEKYNELLIEQKASLEAEYSEYLTFVQKCADESKDCLDNCLHSLLQIELLQSHSKELKDLTHQYEQQLAETKSSQRVKNEQKNEEKQSSGIVAPTTLEKLLKDRVWINDIPRDIFTCLLEMSKELEMSYKCETEALAARYKKELWSKEKEQEAQLDLVRGECERRFNLQLEEARTDIVQALEQHVQQLLSEDNETNERPLELQQLEKKLASKYLAKIDQMQQDHDRQMADIQKCHASECEALQRNLKITNISAEEVKSLQKERDCLRNVAACLRDVVAELVRYFMSCEDELNTTLMNELAKFESDQYNELLSITNHDDSVIDGGDASISQNMPDKGDLSLIPATPTRACPRPPFPKRVRFAPDVSGLLSFIDDDSILECVGIGTSMRDASLNFHEELDRCLARLRLESAALLEISKPVVSCIPTPHAVSMQVGEDSLRSQLDEERRSKIQLSSRLSSSQRNLKQLQQDNEELQAELDAVRREREGLLAELERLSETQTRTQAEVVAEGYGEGDGDDSASTTSPRATTVEELQDKARSLLRGASDAAISPTSCQQLPVIVEELCRDWERLAEEARHRQDDLQQQVEAADKQLRSTRVFLDEQATEREQERDDFMREIQLLQDQLRENSRERNTHQQINGEVETLEIQLKESQSALQEALSKVDRLDAEKKQAVDKIWTLRDIISDLEVQLASKAEEAATIQAQNESLQCLLEQQGRTQFELAQEIEALQLTSGSEILSDRICQLEEELRKHRLQAEHFGDLSAVLLMKSQLHDLEVAVESHTKEMESAHTSPATAVSPPLSSPSEDVSIRETIEAMRAAAVNQTQASPGTCSPITLPIDEVTRLQEQWQRHLRMDDAVLKKVRDLRMHLDDVQAEKDVLSKHLQDQMHLVSVLEAKLDEHRCKFEAKQQEATAPLRSQIENLEAEVHNYVEALDSREQQIKNLQGALHHAELNLSKLEAEVRKSVHAEHNATVQHQHQISKLTTDKEKLLALLSKKHELQSSLPLLVESMLADKNAEIDHLEKQVQELNKQVELGSQYIATPSTTLEFEYCEQEKVRAHVELSPVLELKRSFNVTSMDLEKTELKDKSQLIELSVPSVTETPSLLSHAHPINFAMQGVSKSLLEDNSMAAVEDRTTLNNNSSGSSNLCKAGDAEGSCKHDYESLSYNFKKMEIELAECLTQISEKSHLITRLEERCKQLDEYEVKLAEMSSLENELKAVKNELLCTVKSVNIDKEYFETQLQSKNDEVQHLRDELCASRDIIVNLQRKVQEAKQIAISPSRTSPELKLTLNKLQTDLEAISLENHHLKEKLTISMTSEEQLKKLIECERKTIQSLQEREREIDLELQKANEEIQCKEALLENLQTDIKQLNAECITLKQQFNIPITEAVSLADKLDAEKNFSRALQEELSILKSNAQILELECQDLRKQVNDNNIASNIEEKRALQNEISDLKHRLEEIHFNRNTEIKNVKLLERKLNDKIKDTEKASFDMKKVLKQYQDIEVSKSELQNTVLRKTAELADAIRKSEVFSKELSMLRSALRNIHHQSEFPGLADEDRSTIYDVQKLIRSQALRGGGDGVCQRLSISEINIYEIKPDNSHFSDSGSLDDLTGMVQQELDLSLQLDDTLLQSLNPLAKKKALPVHKLGPVNCEKSESKNKTDFKIHRNCSGHSESGDMNYLQVQLSTEKASNSLLQNQLLSLRIQYETLQKQDSDLIEDLRLKLANALEIEKGLRLQLLQINKVYLSPRFSDKLVETCTMSCPDPISTLQEQLKAVTTELETIKMEKDDSEKQLRRLQEVEVRRSRKRAVNEEHHRGQIDKLKANLLESQNECVILRQQLSVVSDELELTRQELVKEREGHLVANMPVMERLQQMNEFLDELSEENRKLTQQMEQITLKHKTLITRNMQLEQKLHQKDDKVNSKNDRFEAMHPVVNEARSLTVSNTEIEDRINHVFGRYLRSDSYRKALVWQKRYLLSLINGFNECQYLTNSCLSTLRISQHTRGKHLPPRCKFRSAVFALIAISRMHFMVDRWHRGKRIGCSAMLSENYHGISSLHLPLHERPFTPPNYPVSTSADRLWNSLLHSPPTSDRPHQINEQLYASPHSRVSASNVGTASNLSEYVKKFDALNQWFEVVMSHPPK